MLLSVVAIMAFSIIYAQEDELEKKRLTAQFEKQWSTPIVSTSSNVLEVKDGVANIYENHIASYAPKFFDASVKRKKQRKVLLRPYQVHAFILEHKKK